MAELSVEDVEAIAREAHASQVDKAGRPYVEHLQAVVDGVIARGGDGAQVRAAWLHDAVEDEVITREWLSGADLSDRTNRIVEALTRRRGETAEQYAARVLACPGAVLVKEADIAHNADPARLAELDPMTRDRLAAKYAKMRHLLGITATGGLT